MKFGIVIMFMALLLGTAGCGGGGGASKSSSLGSIRTTSVTGVKSVYMTKIGTASTSSPVAKMVNLISSSHNSFVQTLGYISQTGNNEPLVFETSADKKVVLNITSLQAVRDRYIAISFDAMIETKMEALGDGGKRYTFTSRTDQPGKALVDMKIGKVYDLSSYDIKNILVDDNYIYITKNSLRDLYRIAFSDLSQAIPLNNGNYTPAGKLRFIVNNRIVANDHSFDINGATIPKAITSVFLTDSVSTMTGADEPFATGIDLTRDAHIIDNAGNVWGYRYNRYGKFAKFQLFLDGDGKTVVSNYEEFTLGVPLNNWGISFVINGSGYHADHLMVGEQSYYYVKRNANSGIRFEAGLSTFGNSFPGWPGNCATYYNGTLYWVAASTIYAMDLAQNQISAVYSNANLVNPVTVNGNQLTYVTLSVTNGNLLFYQYLAANSVGTYALVIGSTTPTLLSQNEANIEQIVELSF